METSITREYHFVLVTDIVSNPSLIYDIECVSIATVDEFVNGWGCVR